MTSTPVVLVVMDGLRPDMVTADVMPNLCAFRRRGTDFIHARSVYPSVTAVAAASMATGGSPSRHGILGNEMIAGVSGRDRLLDLRDYRIVRGLDQHFSHGLVDAATFADVLALARLRVAIVDAGAPVATTLLNPRAASNGHWTFSTSGRDATPTPRAWDDVVARFGFPPERELPHFDEVSFATNVFADHVIGTLAPDVAILWLPEPDATSRWREIGSLETENALRHADRQLGRVLDAVERRWGLERTVLIVASDHGQISASHAVDIAAEMRAAGFRVGDRANRSTDDEVLVFGQGYGAVSLVSGDDARLEHRVVAWLMEQPWMGTMMTRTGRGVEGRVPGTLSLDFCGLGHERTPHVVFSFASDCGFDRHGVRGRGAASNWSIAGCLATHGGLSSPEMSTVLVATGPGFGRGERVAAAAGIVDIAPTVTACFDLAMDTGGGGRDLAGIAQEPRQTARIETGAGGFLQSVVIAQASAGRLELDGRWVEPVRAA